MENIQRWQVAFIISCIFSLFCTEILPFSIILITFLLSACLFLKQKPVLAAAVFGFCWFFLHAYWLTHWSLPEHLYKKPVTVVGVISDIPSPNTKDIRFNLKLHAIEGQTVAFWQNPRLRITWHNADRSLGAGDLLQFKAKLKPPHGFANEGGFSFQKWLMLNGIRATGYVDKKHDLTVISTGNGQRQAIFNSVMSGTNGLEYQGMLLALTVGEKQLINPEQWQLIKAGGISHLLAISGLHIGIIFLLASLMLKWLLNLYCALYDKHIIVPKYALLGGLTGAFGYAWLAGFAIPTVRALLMLAIAVLTFWFNKSINPRTVVIHALFLILFINPLAVLEPGLWLSVIAVIVIITVFWWFPTVTRNKLSGYLYSVTKMQMALFVFMLPLTMMLFNGFSGGSILVNLIAVPWVSFTTVPLALLGATFELLGIPAKLLFSLANGSLEWLFAILKAADVQQSWFTPRALPWYVWALVVIFALSLCLPLSKISRSISTLLLVPALLAYHHGQGQFNIHILDVGQGLSVVIEKNRQVMVYDLGPVYKSGFNTVDSVVLPFLTFHGYDKANTLILSHSDSDHAGHWQNFLEHIDTEQVIAPEKLGIHTRICDKRSEQWQGLKVDFLWPYDTNAIPKNSNDSSCVVRISDGQHSILLTGDISKRVEKHLVSNYGDELRSTILIAPHHGSNSSSSSGFIEAVSPTYVIYSTGFLNHYKFPRQSVMQRYEQAGVKQLNTRETGQISFSIDQSLVIETARQSTFKQWFYNK